MKLFKSDPWDRDDFAAVACIAMIYLPLAGLFTYGSVRFETQFIGHPLISWLLIFHCVTVYCFGMGCGIRWLTLK
ncbi:MAG: hypothetical protein QG658_527 [Patescibacteria group bacterium]|jgi:hypothetical protein|nr:hypothetical protein [Patescibacteria group bacterium]